MKLIIQIGYPSNHVGVAQTGWFYMLLDIEFYISFHTRLVYVYKSFNSITKKFERFN